MYGDQSGEFLCGSWALKGQVMLELHVPYTPYKVHLQTMGV